MNALQRAAGVGLGALFGCGSAPSSSQVLPQYGVVGAASIAVATAQASSDTGCKLELAPVSDDARSVAPAYLLTQRGLVRVDSAGGRLIKAVPRATEVKATVYTAPQYFAGPEGKLWMSRDDGLYVLGPTDRTLRRVAAALDRKWFYNLIVRSDSDIWALAIEGEVASRRSTAIAHFDGSSWQTTDVEALFGEGSRPFGLVATRDALWVSTKRGLWRGGAGGWQLVDPSAPYQIYASQNRLTGALDGVLHVRDSAWQPRFFPEQAKARGISAVGASGLLAWSGSVLSGSFMAPWPGGGLSSLQGQCPWRNGIGPRGDAISFYTGSAIDGNNRVWIPGYNGFRVANADGRQLADYRAGMLEGLTDDVLAVVVPGGGPKTLPAALPRRSMDMVGRLEIGRGGRGLADATIEVAIGDEVVRSTKSGADGSFRLSSIPEGHYGVVVRPPASEAACPEGTSQTGFDLWTTRDCSPARLVRGECNLGGVQQCQQVKPKPAF